VVASGDHTASVERSCISISNSCALYVRHFHILQFLPRDASAERGDATVSRPSVCLSLCNDQVPCSNTLEFFENYFTAKYLKVHVLVDAQHGRSGATGTPPKLGWNIGCELELNHRGDNARLLIYV